MKNLIIIGAGDFGREICSWLPDCKGFMTEWKFKGFIDSNKDALGPEGWSGHKVMSTILSYEPKRKDVFLCAIAKPNFRKRSVEIITEKGGEFISIIHNSSSVDQSSDLGVGVFVSPFCTISCDTRIGDHCLFNTYAAIGHDVVIREYSHINSFVLLGGYSRIGEGSTVHPSAVILPSKQVGNNVVVGAGSIVIHNVPNDRTVFGNPAKLLL